LGEWKKISGQAALEAFVLGYEVETRIGVGIGFGHYERGWHSTSTFGRFGAAVAAGKLLGLSLDQMLYAMGLAGTQASGVRLVFGTMAKPFHAGKSASDGVLSALMAERGFTCAPNIIEGKKGYVEAMGEGANLDRMVQDLGKVYEIRNNTFKFNASCLLTHPIIDAVRELRNRHDLRMEHIKEIQCEVAKLCLDTAGNEDPQTGLAGKFSVHYCTALALAEEMAGEDMFSDSKVLNPDMVRLRKKVKVKIASELKETEAKACIKTLDGKEYATFVGYPKGDPHNPLSDEELENKFRSLAAGILPKEKIESLLKTLWSLEKVRDIGQVISLCH
jgi:2-methylcitrate dehydratase PrpD